MATRRKIKTKKTFRLSHSLIGGAGLLVLEALAIVLAPDITDWLVCVAAVLGSIAALSIATEVIEEVRSARHMLQLLVAVVAEFVLFFAFQYYFLLGFDPNSFPTLSLDPLSLLLHSTMIFVFNPL